MGKHQSSVRIFISRVFDATVYGAIVALVGCLISGFLGFLLLGSLNGMKLFLFIAGFLMIGVGVAQLWPTDISDVRNPNKGSPDYNSRVQLVVDWLVPTDQIGLPAEERFNHGVKLFVAGGLMLAISFSMEAVFGITG